MKRQATSPTPRKALCSRWLRRSKLRAATLGGLLIIVATCALAAGPPPVVADDAPRVRVTNVRRAFHNGEHNAFTDMIRFGQRFYLTFRSCPDGHGVSPTASIIILASDDAQSWEIVHRFHVPLRDTRDPHFLIFDGKLFVYTGTWYCGESKPQSYEMNQHLGYAVFSRDGKQWEGPRMLEGTYGHYIWRAAAHDGKAWLCGRRKREFAENAPGERSPHLVESALLESDDGLAFRTRSLFQETEGNETAFLFEPDGSILAVSRRSREAELCRSELPYRQWQRQPLDRFIGGPLLARWGDRTVVGGRKTSGDQGPKTSLCWLQDGQLQEFAELPSGGDNSYPGWVALSPTRAVVSWYSSHEQDEQGRRITAIYLADLTIEQE